MSDQQPQDRLSDEDARLLIQSIEAVEREEATQKETPKTAKTESVTSESS